MELQEPNTRGSSEEQVIDLQNIIYILLKWWWVIAVFAIVFPVAAYFYTNYTYVPQYMASATMVVNSKQLEVVGKQVVVNNDIYLSQKLTKTYSVILKSDRVMELVAKDLGLNLHPLVIRQYVSVVPTKKDTELLSVNVINTDPELAAKICNSIMKVAPEAILSTIEVGSVNVVDFAKIPGYPEPPATARNTAAAALFGLVLGIGLVFLIRLFDNTIKNGDDVKARLGLTLLGGIPYISPQGKKDQNLVIPTLAHINPHWVGFGFVEAYKAIRTNLQFVAAVNSARKLLVTSALNGEGKSTTTINLAITLAQSGKSVLVIDCDLRKPNIHKLLDLQVEKGKGLASVLSGDLEAKAAIVFMEGPGIYIMPRGPVVPNPSELLGSEKMAGLLALLEPDYDYILLDTPPVCLFTDAVALSRYCDGVIFVVKQCSVKVDTIYSTLDNFKNVNARILGCVLNGIKYKEAGARYNYHYHDRYYSHYYTDAVSLRSRISWAKHYLLRKAASRYVYMPLTFTGLLLIGIALWGYFSPIYHSSKLLVQPASVVSSTYGRAETKLAAYPQFGEQYATLLMPSLGINRPVFFGDTSEQLRAGVGHYSGSSFPGEGGTIVYAGHNDLVFKKLKDIKPGDDVLIQTNYGSFRYRVFDAHIINSNNTVHIEPKGAKAVLVMYTCYAYDMIGLKSDRYVVFAEQVQEAPATSITNSLPINVLPAVSSSQT